MIKELYVLEELLLDEELEAEVWIVKNAVTSELVARKWTEASPQKRVYFKVQVNSPNLLDEVSKLKLAS